MISRLKRMKLKVSHRSYKSVFFSSATKSIQIVLLIIKKHPIKLYTIK